MFQNTVLRVLNFVEKSLEISWYIFFCKLGINTRSIFYISFPFFICHQYFIYNMYVITCGRKNVRRQPKRKHGACYTLERPRRGGGSIGPPIGFSDLRFEAFMQFNQNETFGTRSPILSASFDVNWMTSSLIVYT